MPTALAASWLWLEPKACDTRGDPATYRWMCLLPVLTVAVAPVTGAVLGAGALLSRRLARWIGLSLLATATFWGLTVHVFLIGSLVIGDPSYVAIFLWDVLLLPQPAVSGALAGAVYVGALAWRRGRAQG